MLKKETNFFNIFKPNRLIFKELEKKPVTGLEKPKKKIETGNLKDKRKDLSGQTSSPLASKTPEKEKEKFNYKDYFNKKLNKEQIKELKEKFAKTIPSEDVLKLQEANPSIITDLFCETSDINEGFTFKTHGNKSVERSIGLVNVYANDFGIKEVIVTKPSGAEIHGKREGFAGNFYNERGKCIYIFEGYAIKATNRLAKEETAKIQHAFIHETEKNIAYLKDKVPPQLQARFSEPLVPKIVREGLIQGVNPKYLLALLAQENGEKDYEFGITSSPHIKGYRNQLRWAATIVKNNEKQYERFGKKIKDGNGNYTLGFLAYNSEKYAPLSASEKNQYHFSNIKKIYEKLCGSALTGQEDVEDAIKLAKRSERVKSITTSLSEIIDQKPELKEVWDKIKKLLEEEKIPYDNESKQDGLSLWILQKNALNYLKTPRTLEIIKLLAQKGWNFNIKNLRAIHEFANINTDRVAEYRNKNLPKLKEASITEALDIISKTPQKHAALTMPNGASITSDYAYRGAIADSDGSVRSRGGWHSGIDIGVKEYMLTAPENGRVILRKHEANGAGYWIDFVCKDTNGDDIMFRFFHCTKESYENLEEEIKRRGNFFKKGDQLLRTGASGNATTKSGKELWHLHLSIYKNGYLADPVLYLPRNLQDKVIAYRDVRKDSERYKYTNQLAAKDEKRGKLLNPKEILDSQAG